MTSDDLERMMAYNVRPLCEKTVRDMFAGLALHAMLTADLLPFDVAVRERLVDEAYDYADKMMVRRNSQEAKENITKTKVAAVVAQPPELLAAVRTERWNRFRAFLAEQKSRGISQQEVAIRCGTPAQYLSDMKRGRRPITELLIRRISTAFNVDFNWLFNPSKEELQTPQAKEML